MRRIDFEPKGGRPDQFRADHGFTRQDAAVIAGMIAASSEHPYIDPTKVDKISVEPVSGDGGGWYVAEAFRASTIYTPDPKKVPPDQIPQLMDAVRRDAERLANNEGHRPGLTTVPNRPGLATMYRGQIRGTGVDKDMTYLAGRGEFPDVRNPKGRINVFVVTAFYGNGDIGRGLERSRDVGYGMRESTNGKLKRR